METIVVIIYIVLALIFAAISAYKLVDDSLSPSAFPNGINVLAGIICGILFPISVPIMLLYYLSVNIGYYIERIKYGSK